MLGEVSLIDEFTSADHGAALTVSLCNAHQRTSPTGNGADGMNHTETEIFSQPDVWQQTIDELSVVAAAEFWNAAQPESILTTGCGSTYYLALTLAALIRDELGIPGRAVAASEVALGSRPIPQAEHSLMVAISRSGTTSETLAAVDRFRELGGRGVITVTNDLDSTLAEAADIVVAAPAGREESVAQTRSFSSMLLTAQALVGALAGYDLSQLSVLPDLASALLADATEPVRTLAHDVGIDRFFFLGSDPLFGVASEGMLKLKEMSLTNSEAFHTLEFRHGPMSMADRSAAIVALISADRVAAEMAVVADAGKYDAATLTIGAAADLVVDAEIPSWMRPVLHLIPLQILALERAKAKGLNPDLPRNLVAVVELDRLGEVAHQ